MLKNYLLGLTLVSTLGCFFLGCRPHRRGIVVIQGQPGPQGPQGDAGPPGPGLIWKGTWNYTTTYQVGDVVCYQGSSYVAIQSSLNIPPGVVAGWWDVVAVGNHDHNHDDHHDHHDD